MQLGILLVLLSFLSGLAAQAAEGLRIISDVDDTVKVTHVGHPEMILRGTLWLKLFSGMPGLYQELAPAELLFVSGSPRFLRKSIRRHLRNEGFPAFRIQTRDLFARPGIFEFKVARIARAISESEPSARFLLIGDDTERDPETYAEVMRRHPDRIAAVYIRKIRGRASLPGQLPFYTAMDIALREFDAGRLDLGGVLRVAQDLVSDRRPPEENLLPDFAACPPRGWLLEGVPVHSPVFFSALEVQELVDEVCRAREPLTLTSRASAATAPAL
ncbi:MAG: DUF2183 domain-containing protein [Oligoflexia bacterium]|nr:DUF2183 domain-containing protein [Oligoflexia bacterium]